MVEEAVNGPLEDSAAPGDRVDVNEPGSLARWSQKLDVTEAQLLEAVGAVGDLAADVEMHLKGSHATTNADQEARADQATRPE